MGDNTLETIAHDISEILINEGFHLVGSESNLSLSKGNLRVRWIRLGEGYNGDFNPEDSEDIELLRFEVERRESEENVWEFVEGASYLTNFPVESTLEEKFYGLLILFKSYEDALEDYPYSSIKQLGENLSWINPEDANRLRAQYSK